MYPLSLLKNRQPNELGRIPIVMYHSVDDSLAIDRNGLNISKATFREHLDLFLRYGMYPLNLRDLRSHNALSSVPRGLVPVVLTFDDGRRSQFVMREDETPHPDSALGILENFIQQRATYWKRRASFYVMPQSTYNLEPFRERGLAPAKLNYLVEQGYEIGNHTWSHRSLRKMSERQVVSELVRCFYGIRTICPRATMDTLCIPFGEYPRIDTWRKILANPLCQKSDMHSIVLMAWGGASYSPFDKRYDPLRVRRIGVAPNELENTLLQLARTESWYVSGESAGVLQTNQKSIKNVAQAYLNYLPKASHQQHR